MLFEHKNSNKHNQIPNIRANKYKLEFLSNHKLTLNLKLIKPQ